MMRLPLSLILAAGILATSPAFAATPMHATITCREFVSYDEVTLPKVVCWAEGAWRKGRPQDAVMDIEETERLIPIVTDQGRRGPQAPFMTELKQAWDKLNDDIRRHV
ncbi:HdeA/HdeB family chaperone [Novosphingobium sp.]|uniref:HdeA/HdeB family chaperone n=1 Tax=Novosphingobium sp. TaxID=1874826 RepID=UPI003B520542